MSLIEIYVYAYVYVTARLQYAPYTYIYNEYVS